MGRPQEDDASRPARLDEVLAEYMQRVDAGEAVDREELLREHPGLVEELRAYFEAADRVEQMAGPAAPETLLIAESAKASAAPLGVVRYFGDYELLEEIGRGGMGVIYKARQVSLNRIVAVKMILAGQLAGGADIQRFHTEAEAAANLQHPNIVAIHEVGEHEGQHYFSMDYVAGTSLAEMVGEHPLPAKQAAGYVQTIAEAIHYAHEQGTLHRDLKPSNVLIDRNDQPRVTDFGLAKRVTDERGLTVTGAVLGTPSYMSPEQAEGRQKDIGPRNDVYSLGAIVYELVSGRPPYRAETAAATVMQVLHAEPVSPRLLNPGVPRDLETICLKCLEKEPRRRYASAQALADELRRFLAGEPIQARPIGAPARAWRWCRRKPVVASLAAALAAAVVAGFVGIASQWRRAEGEAERTRRHLYAAHMNLAHRDWQAGDVGPVLERLASHQPKAGQEDLRSFEWYYLWRLCHRDRRTFEFAGGNAAIVLSPDGKTLAAGGWGVDQTTVPYTYQTRGWWVFGPLRTRTAYNTMSKSILQVKLWDVATGTLHGTLKRSDIDLTSLAFSPDGSTLAWVSDKRIYQAGDGSGYVGGEGSGPDTHQITLWDVATGKERGTLQVPSQPYCVAFGARGGLLAVGHAEGVTLWDTSGISQGRDANQLATLSEGHFAYGAAFSPDGKTLATVGAWHAVVLWDLSTREQVAMLKVYTGWGQGDCVAFSPDGRLLAAHRHGATGDLVWLWEVATGKLLVHHGEQRAAGGCFPGPDRLRFSADGRILAAAVGSAVKLWHTFTRIEVATLKGHTDPVCALAFGSDGKTLVSATTRTAKVWDLGREIQADVLRPAEEPTGGAECLAFSPDGRLLAAVNASETAWLWDVSSGRQVATLKGHTRVEGQAPSDRFKAVAFSPSGGQLATGGEGSAATGERSWLGRSQAWLWDISVSDAGIAGSLAQVVQGKPGDGFGGLAFSPDGQSLLLGIGKQLRLRDLATGKERLIPHDPQALGLRPDRGDVPSLRDFDGFTLSRDGRKLVSSHWHGDYLAVWDIAKGEAIALVGRGRMQAQMPQSSSGMALSPDGELLATAHGDNVIRISSLASLTGRTHLERGLRATLKGHSAPPMAVAFFPDGKTLASAGHDALIKIWDVATGEERLTLAGHAGPVEALAVSPSGRVLASGSYDGTIRLWRAATDEEVLARSSSEQARKASP